MDMYKSFAAARPKKVLAAPISLEYVIDSGLAWKTCSNTVHHTAGFRRHFFLYLRTVAQSHLPSSTGISVRCLCCVRASALVRAVSDQLLRLIINRLWYKYYQRVARTKSLQKFAEARY
jgi:hypothetical protein